MDKCLWMEKLTNYNNESEELSATVCNNYGKIKMEPFVHSFSSKQLLTVMEVKHYEGICHYQGLHP